MPSTLIREETTMPAYKTIVLELLQDQYPRLHQQLRARGLLLQAVDDYATAMRTIHRAWIDEIRTANPGLDPIQVSAEALEMTLRDFQDALPSESPPRDAAEETFTLDAAMAFLRSHTPPA
jgi:hypothetical protein